MPPSLCACCFDPFLPRAANQLYCSIRCSNMMTRKRRKERDTLSGKVGSRRASPFLALDPEKQKAFDEATSFLNSPRTPPSPTQNKNNDPNNDAFFEAYANRAKKNESDDT